MDYKYTMIRGASRIATILVGRQVESFFSVVLIKLYPLLAIISD